MVYLEYETSTNQVVEIHDTKPVLTKGYDFVVSEDFAVGDEFEKTIWIQEYDDQKNILSYSAIRNNPNAKRLLEENKQLKERLALSESAIDFLIMNGGM